MHVQLEATRPLLSIFPAYFQAQTTRARIFCRSARRFPTFTRSSTGLSLGALASPLGPLPSPLKTTSTLSSPRPITQAGKTVLLPPPRQSHYTQWRMSSLQGRPEQSLFGRGLSQGCVRPAPASPAPAPAPAAVQRLWACSASGRAAPLGRRQGPAAPGSPCRPRPRRAAPPRRPGWNRGGTA